MGLLGAHVSASGGVEKVIGRGEDLFCEAVQIFSKNQRQWKAPPLTEASVAAFKERWSGSTVKEVVIHDSYLINLAHPENDALEKSRSAMTEEVNRAHRLGVSYLVFHPGSHLNTGEKKGLKTIAQSIDFVLDNSDSEDIVLLLETTAGQGSNLGYTFEQLAEVIDESKYESKLGVCFDTAHTFEAGYDFRTPEGYKKVFDEFNRILGIDRLKVFHLNDSKTDLGTKVDRHENIGKGFIGIKLFELLVNDGRFSGIPMILETPGGEEKFRENLSFLRSLIR